MKPFTACFQIIVLLSLCTTLDSLPARAAQRGAPIVVGDLAPDFTLEDQNRNKVRLSASHGKSPVVLVFYRGYW